MFYFMLHSGHESTLPYNYFLNPPNFQPLGQVDSRQVDRQHKTTQVQVFERGTNTGTRYTLFAHLLIPHPPSCPSLSLSFLLSLRLLKEPIASESSSQRTTARLGTMRMGPRGCPQVFRRGRARKKSPFINIHCTVPHPPLLCCLTNLRKVDSTSRVLLPSIISFSYLPPVACRCCIMILCLFLSLLHQFHRCTTALDQIGGVLQLRFWLHIFFVGSWMPIIVFIVDPSKIVM